MLTRTPLLDRADELRRRTAGTVPGRLVELIDARIAQLLALPGAPPLPDDLDEAERCVLDIAEQFVVDVHGITDARFAGLGEHFTSAEQVAIMFHLAFADGFAKLRKVHPDSADVVGEPTLADPNEETP